MKERSLDETRKLFLNMWTICSVAEAADLFFKSPWDRTRTKEWTFHQADVSSTEGKNALRVRWAALWDGVFPITVHVQEKTRRHLAEIPGKWGAHRAGHSFHFKSYESKTSRSLESFNLWHADGCWKQIKISESNIRLWKNKVLQLFTIFFPFLIK